MSKKSLSCIANVTRAGDFSLPATFIRDVENTFRGKEVRVIVRKDYNKVSTKEHRFYRGPFLDAVMDCFIEAGHPFQKYNTDDRDTAHNFLKQAFGPKENLHLPVPSPAENIPVSMSRWTTVETEEYMERIRQWMSEIFGAVLPYPNEELAPKEG